MSTATLALDVMAYSAAYGAALELVVNAPDGIDLAALRAAVERRVNPGRCPVIADAIRDVFEGRRPRVGPG